MPKRGILSKGGYRLMSFQFVYLLYPISLLIWVHLQTVEAIAEDAKLVNLVIC
jgi:hypothetical protein